MGDEAAAPVANVGGDVADAHVGHGEVVPGGSGARAPPAQHVADGGIGKQRVMRGVCPVHGGDVGHHGRANVVIVVGGDADPAGTLDQPGRMADEGEAYLGRRKCDRANGGRLHRRRRPRYGQAPVGRPRRGGANGRCQASQQCRQQTYEVHPGVSRKAVAG